MKKMISVPVLIMAMCLIAGCQGFALDSKTRETLAPVLATTCADMYEYDNPPIPSGHLFNAFPPGQVVNDKTYKALFNGLTSVRSCTVALPNTGSPHTYVFFYEGKGWVMVSGQHRHLINKPRFDRIVRVYYNPDETGSRGRYDPVWDKDFGSRTP